MEVALTPLEFARRTRRLHGHREGVVDGDLRLTYEEFFDRCDRWSTALQAMGVAAGDRLATIAPNTHAQLEAFYAVPQIGAVLVPVNYRLTADDFSYILNHSAPRWSGADHVHPGSARALQDAQGGHVRRRAAQDRDRQDPEIRAPLQRAEPGPTVVPGSSRSVGWRSAHRRPGAPGRLCGLLSGRPGLNYPGLNYRGLARSPSVLPTESV